MTAETTTIQVSKKTRDALASIGNKDETFEDIIKRLLKEHEKQ